MALSGLEIYKYLPKTNCRECGFPTCLAFALQIAAKKVPLDRCPHLKEEAKLALESASLPPIKLVTIGVDDNKLEVGNETIMFRHEETFYHPTGIGFLIEDNLSQEEITQKVDAINKLQFERVGQVLKVNLIAVRQSSGNSKTFADAVKKVETESRPLVLMSENYEALKLALASVLKRRPLLYAATKDNFEHMAGLAKEYNLPLVVLNEDLEGLAELVKKINNQGVTDLILDTGKKPLSHKIAELTQIRRLALKKNFRALGYPTIALSINEDSYQETAEVASYIAKYASIVIMKGIESWQALALLTLRQNIYTDPQKPLQVEAKLNSIGGVTEKSPVAVTTNFSLTYYTVLSEIEASKVPTYLITVDTEGMSVLTAWAAEKFTAEKIAASLENCGVKEKVSHHRVIIPGYVAVMSGELEEKSGWQVLVGPCEASGIPAFLKNL
jgi:acetyl-CoA decarbonylase/synthase complex subunit gamma